MNQKIEGPLIKMWMKIESCCQMKIILQEDNIKKNRDLE